MITDEIRKIDEKINSLEGWQGLAYSEIAWTEKIVMICHKHGFSEHDTTEIMRELGYILLNVSQPEEFYDQIKNRTSLTDASIRILADDIVKEILIPLESNIQFFEEASATLLQQARQRELEYEKEEATGSHILLVPIKPKEGEIVAQNPVKIPQNSISDPYREIPE